MTFKLPDFTKTNCHVIGACGSLNTKSKKALELVDGESRRLFSQFNMGGMQAWLVVILGGKEPNHHFHLDVVRKGLIQELPGSVEERSLDEIQALLRPMIGRSIRVMV